MRIGGARLTGFRNLADAELSFSPGVNVLVGRNGQGKSNLLEALDFPALGRSRRGARGEELIAFGRDHLHVALDLEDTADGRRRLCEYALDRAGSRRFKVDGEPVSRRADLMGQLATVFFQPESIDLVRGEPELRRRHVDQGLAVVDAVYLGHLAAFQRALRQKTSLLRDVQRGMRDRRQAREEVAAWNREFAHHAAPLCLARLAYVTALDPAARAIYEDLAGGDGGLEIAYRPSLGSCREASAREELARDILEEIDYIGENEFRRGRPLIGPHRDDFEIRLGGRELKTFGSQGETRTAAVSLILAQSEVVFQRRGTRPVLFLDDIFSELDPHRTGRMRERCARDHQVFVATARPEDVGGWRPDALRCWRVDAGVLTEIL
jgi:DNA replication and repair protein RecF